MLIDTLTFSPHEYSKNIKALYFSQIVLEGLESTYMQPWELVCELLCRVSSSLEKLHLGTGDDGFLECIDCMLPPRINFPLIRELYIQEKCIKFSQPFLVDLLRRCCPSTNSLQVLRFSQCLGGFDGTGWWLVVERGGGMRNSKTEKDTFLGGLEDLELTPSPVGTDDPYSTTGWAPEIINQGIINLQLLKNLRRLNLSGIRGIDSQVLESFVLSQGSMNLEVLNLMDCVMSDMHLHVIQKGIVNGYLPKLEILNVGCSNCLSTATHGPRPLVSKKTSIQSIRDPSSFGSRWNCLYGNCGRISDTVALLLLESLSGRTTADAAEIYFRFKKVPVGAVIVLPRWMCEVKTGKIIPSILWAERLPGAKLEMYDTNRIVYLDIAVEIPNGRFIL
ncbi:hypothetical protein HK096_008007 [Nowakowskiella sp. JEL0078]|nr:hypothetical protein HK096_008007 [Nowakowskiella sp. JEL0078]